MFASIEMPLYNGKVENIEFVSNAATCRRYKMIFGDDLLTKFANAEKDVDGVKKYDIDFLPELAYVMAMQAAAMSDQEVNLLKLNNDTFIDWLEQFDSMSFENKATEILNVYLGTQITASEPKKNKEELKEK